MQVPSQEGDYAQGSDDCQVAIDMPIIRSYADGAQGTQHMARAG